MPRLLTIPPSFLPQIHYIADQPCTNRCWRHMKQTLNETQKYRPAGIQPHRRYNSVNIARAIACDCQGPILQHGAAYQNTKTSAG
ncbi:hypothetical protein PAXRUDRAFT_829035 [Paxillus rubicundulus Ve08.2h10]|uniref:Uncharacterized protein n=1 Tax=Paxillus rubicundulus Ve08.2h10 TaxID=930991 RepID=A0A0D0E6M3_9AGAM|nr:hypothetical protein PAXRUDRAFT_829035 [Paxillus rubicundulus Ve08.2h10]